MTQRVYETWKGSNKFILGGRLIFGPDARSLPVTVLLIVVPVILFCVFVARHLRHEFSPNNAGYAISVVAILFTIYVLILLCFTSARDPGIVPRNSHPPEEDLRYETTVSADGRQTPSVQIPRTKEVIVNGVSVRVKYCDTCMLYRPPRCSHCSICNNCVERFDHHCPWVGQCIGLRNYRYFFMFVSSATLLCIYVFSMSAFYIKILMDDQRGTVWRAMRESPLSVVLMVYCFIALWFVGGLTGFHLYLISTNQTTYENFRYRPSSRTIVYNRGCANNFLEVFCSKVKPSRNDFRAFIKEEPPRVVTLTPTTREESAEAEDETGTRRQKVEDDLDIGDDLMNISQRCNAAEASNDQPHHTLDIDQSIIGSAERAATIRTETRHGSWGRRSGSWDIAADVANSNVRESRFFELKMVSWLEVTGSFEKIEPGKTYQIGFKISFKPDAAGWDKAPVFMSAKIGKKGKPVWKRIKSVNQNFGKPKSGSEKPVTIPDESDGSFQISVSHEPLNQEDTKLQFGLYEVWTGRWKTGLLIHEAFLVTSS